MSLLLSSLDGSSNHWQFDLMVFRGLYFALLIRVGSSAGDWITNEVLLVALLSCASLLMFWRLGMLSKAIIRYLDVDLLSVIFVGSLASVLFVVISTFLFNASFPRSVPIIFFTTTFFGISGVRLFFVEYCR